MITATSATRSELATADDFESGAFAPVISRYRLGERIGAGGMGVVYLARDRVMGRCCAVKVNRPEDSFASGAERRLQFEIDVLNQLSHPHIVRLLDHGRTYAGACYFAMEYVAGDDLNKRVERCGPLDIDYTVSVLRRLCGAVGEVHAQGFVHGDIKPANVVTAATCRRCDSVKVIDFGLARSVGCPKNDNAQAAATGSFAGSPLYAAPESYAGEVDGRSDIYSLGATAYYLLTGRPVFDEDRPLAAIVAHAGRAPVSVRRIRPGIPAALDAIVMRCLCKNPNDRFQNADELEVALAETARHDYWNDRLEPAPYRTVERSFTCCSDVNSCGGAERCKASDLYRGKSESCSHCAA